MISDRLPRWSLWVAAALVFWTGWALGLGRPLVRKIAALEGQQRETETELTALESRMSAVPDLVARLSRSVARLDSTLDRYSTAREIDTLLQQIRHSGLRRGLGDVRVDPELMSILQEPTASLAKGHAGIQLDTILIFISAEGPFGNIGAWLDEIEERIDFRYWTLCQWSPRDEGSAVALEAQAGMVVVARPELSENQSRVEVPE